MQTSLGETKKDKASANVPVFVKFNDQKLVLGTLSWEKFPQISYDIVFEKEFKLSHISKSTGVFFCGYKTVAAEESVKADNPKSSSAARYQSSQWISKQSVSDPISGSVLIQSMDQVERSSQWISKQSVIQSVDQFWFGDYSPGTMSLVIYKIFPAHPVRSSQLIKSSKSVAYPDKVSSQVAKHLSLPMVSLAHQGTSSACLSTYS